MVLGSYGWESPFEGQKLILVTSHDINSKSLGRTKQIQQLPMQSWPSHGLWLKTLGTCFTSHPTQDNLGVAAWVTLHPIQRRL